MTISGLHDPRDHRFSDPSMAELSLLYGSDQLVPKATYLMQSLLVRMVTDLFCTKHFLIRIISESLFLFNGLVMAKKNKIHFFVPTLGPKDHTEFTAS